MEAIIAQTIGAFGVFMPGAVVSARHMNPDDPTERADFTLGITLSIAWSFVVAAAVAGAGDTSKPYLYWLLTVGVIVGLYILFFRAPLPDATAD